MQIFLISLSSLHDSAWLNRDSIEVELPIVPPTR